MLQLVLANQSFLLQLSSSICSEKYSVKNTLTAARSRDPARLSQATSSVYSYTAAHWRPARLPLLRRACSINQSRLNIVLFQPTRGRVYPLQKNSLLDPGKKHFVLEASGYYELGKTIVREHLARKFFSSLKTAYYFSSIREDDFKLELIVFGKIILATQDLKCCLS